MASPENFIDTAVVPIALSEDILITVYLSIPLYELSCVILIFFIYCICSFDFDNFIGKIK